jgi:integrase
MRMFKQKRRVKGKLRSDDNWTLEFRDADGRPRRFAAFIDKSLSAELARRITKLIELRTLGGQPDAELNAWLQSMPRDLRKRLAGINLLDSRIVASGKPLLCHRCGSTWMRLDDKGPCDCPENHLADFRDALEHKGNTLAHVKLVTTRIRKVFQGCGFAYYNEISGSRVQQYLAELRKGTKSNDEIGANDGDKAGGKGKASGKGSRGRSAQTSNFYLTALKSFCRWMIKDRRATESPVEYLTGLNVKTDRRHDRRHLTPAELATLLTTTAGGPVRFRLTGQSRAMLYRVAAESGLRRKELRTLTPASFDFDGDTPTVAVVAGESKNRKTTRLPIRADLITELRKWFKAADVGPNDRLWPGLTRHTADMLKADLEVAGIPYVDAAGLFADFHSLRHSFISMLAAGGIHPKLAQKLARHSDINLTMNRYSHTLLTDEAQALESLPAFPSAFDSPKTGKRELRATGTDDVAANGAMAGKGTKASGKGEACFEASAASDCVAIGRNVTEESDDDDESSGTTAKTKLPNKPDGSGILPMNDSGEGGIRTLESGIRPTGFRDRPIRPLWHLSGAIKAP